MGIKGERPPVVASISRVSGLVYLVSRRTGDVLKWGDEVEYMLVHFDDEAQRVRLSLKAEPVLRALQVRKRYFDTLINI